MKIMNVRFVKIARRFDFMWPAVRLALRLSRTPPRIDPRTIMVVDLHLIGDIVLLLPLLSMLRESFPTAHITLVAGPWAASLISPENIVNEHIDFLAPWVKSQSLSAVAKSLWTLIRRLRKRQWDWAIDVRGDVRQILLLALVRARRRIGFDFTGGSALLTDIVVDDGKLHHLADHHFRLAKHLGVWREGAVYRPRIHLTPQERGHALTILPFIGFHFGASNKLRQLPAAQAARLIESCVPSDQKLVLFEPDDVRDYNMQVRQQLNSKATAQLEICRPSNLREFVTIASRAERAFTMDSGPAHIFAALGVPTTVFFGPNLPRYVAPLGEKVAIIETQGLRCRPCDQTRCVNAIYQACMTDLVCHQLPDANFSDSELSEYV